jgi:hypothetical protein
MPTSDELQLLQNLANSTQEFGQVPYPISYLAQPSATIRWIRWTANCVRNRTYSASGLTIGWMPCLDPGSRTKIGKGSLGLATPANAGKVLVPVLRRYLGTHLLYSQRNATGSNRVYYASDAVGNQNASLQKPSPKEALDTIQKRFHHRIPSH